MNGFEKLGIGPDKPPKLILDFCWNHEGSIGRVRQMLQRLREVLTPEQYQLVIPKFQAGRDLPWDRPMYRGVKRMCEDEFGLPFLCTAFDHKAVDMLVSLGVDAIKIGSAEADSLEFVEHVSALKPTIVSTGGLNAGQLAKLQKTAFRDPRIILMHCISQYPARAEDLNLGEVHGDLVYWTDDGELWVPANMKGYSSHYPEVIDAIFAMALGAQVIEKHFSLTPGMQGDHLVSIGALQARVICDAALVWHKMRGYTKSQETLDAERALLKPFRERFSASSKQWHDEKFGQPHYGHHDQTDQDPGKDQVPSGDERRTDSERS